MPLFCVTPTGSDARRRRPAADAGVGDRQHRQRRIGTKVVFVIGAPNPKNSGIEGSRVKPVIKVPRSRIYWYQEVNR